jgi:hypothetical protein
MMWRWIALTLLLQAPSLEPARPMATGTIEGVVVRLGTNEPIEDARVMLINTGSDANSSPPIMTSSDGTFTFKDLTAGSYRLAFAGNGYVRQEYGQRLFFGKGTPIELSEGQTVKGIVSRMTPTGTVSGRIQDSEGHPLPGITVQLMRNGYDAKGQQILRSFGKAQTNDLGEYRIYFVTPGPYYLGAGQVRGEFAQIQNRESYIPAFYPGVRDPRSASLIEILAGSETRGVDLTLQRQERLFVVRGRVVDSSTGKAPENIGGLHLEQTDVIGNFDGSGRSDVPLYQNGTFEFPNVAPGRYSLVALAYESAAKDREDRIALRQEGIVPIEVIDSNIDGIEVRLRRGFTISGRLRQEDGGALSGVSLWNVSTGGPPQGAHLTPISISSVLRMKPDFSHLEGDGTFQVLNMMPGEYLFSIDWLGDQYLKEARFGGVDILSRPLRFTGSEASSLEIVLSPNMGTLEGRVLNERLEAVPAAQVALVPDRNRDRPTLFRAVTTDSSGRFQISKIAPGEYKLFAWEALDPYQYFDPELLRRSDSKGVPVHIGELSSQAVTVTAIPAP